MRIWFRDRLRRALGVTHLTNRIDDLNARLDSLGSGLQTTARVAALEAEVKVKQAESESRSGVTDEFRHQLTELKTKNAELESRAASAAALRERIAQLEADLARVQAHAANAANGAVRSLIQRSSAASFFACRFNGVQVSLPRDTLRTMLHCVASVEGEPLIVDVETGHLNWMRSRLNPGDLFLDVGAATGAMTVPIALGLPGVKIVAFEPNRTARKVLNDTLAVNKVHGVEVVDAAVSNATGSVQFAEFRYDDSGNCNFLPEASTIDTSKVHEGNVASRYDVPVTTLDAFFAGRTDGKSVKVVKIDVEGFEVHVLDGALGFLKAFAPAISIDIHADPFGDGTTEAKCLERLQKIGYTADKHGHALLCAPPNR